MPICIVFLRFSPRPSVWDTSISTSSSLPTTSRLESLKAVQRMQQIKAANPTEKFIKVTDSAAGKIIEVTNRKSTILLGPSQHPKTRQVIQLLSSLSRSNAKRNLSSSVKDYWVVKALCHSKKKNPLLIACLKFSLSLYIFVRTWTCSEYEAWIDS